MRTDARVVVKISLHESWSRRVPEMLIVMVIEDGQREGLS